MAPKNRTAGTRSIDSTADEPEATVGTTRRIDQLGRIVIPAELRRLIGIAAGDRIDFRAVDGYIAIHKVAPECALCRSREHLVERNERHICQSCVAELRREVACAMCGGVDQLVERHGNHICQTCIRELSPA